MSHDLLDGALRPPSKPGTVYALGKKKFRVTINSKWLASTWSLPTWDAAYQLIMRAAGNAEAKKELDAIKLAARSGNAQAINAKRSFDVVARMITKGLPKPSTFVASRRGGSPLLPGGKAVSPAIQQQVDRIKREKMHKEVQGRFKAEQAKTAAAQAAVQEMQRQQTFVQAQAQLAEKYEAKLDEAQAQLEMLRKQLERRDLADDIRKQLEAQAEKYESIIDELETKAEGKPTAAPVTEATAAEQPEAEQDDSADAYSSGVPGDVEYNDAGV